MAQTKTIVKDNLGRAIRKNSAVYFAEHGDIHMKLGTVVGFLSRQNDPDVIWLNIVSGVTNYVVRPHRCIVIDAVIENRRPITKSSIDVPILNATFIKPPVPSIDEFDKVEIDEPVTDVVKEEPKAMSIDVHINEQPVQRPIKKKLNEEITDTITMLDNKIDECVAREVDTNEALRMIQQASDEQHKKDLIKDIKSSLSKKTNE